MFFIASILPFHADCFDVLHALLQHCYAHHAHVRGHQDQLLGVEELRELELQRQARDLLKCQLDASEAVFMYLVHLMY